MYSIRKQCMRFRSLAFGAMLAATLLLSSKGESRVNPILKSSDVMANVDGHPITRYDLTLYWLRVKSGEQKRLENVLVDEFEKDGEKKSDVVLSMSRIYQELYPQEPKGTIAPYADILQDLVSEKLVALALIKNHITISKEEMKQGIHLLCNELKIKYQNQFGKSELKTISDSMLLKDLKVPEDILDDDMRLRIGVELLYKRSIEKSLGHAIQPADWIVVRCLYTSAIDKDGDVTAQSKSQAYSRMETILNKMKVGGIMKLVAASDDEYMPFRTLHGKIGPTLKGTYWPPAIEKVIYALNSNVLSTPVYSNGGWWVFRVVQNGDEIPAPVITAAFEQLLESQREAFIQNLWIHSSVISKVNLPIPSVKPVSQPTAPALPMAQF